MTWQYGGPVGTVLLQQYILQPVTSRVVSPGIVPTRGCGSVVGMFFKSIIATTVTVAKNGLLKPDTSAIVSLIAKSSVAWGTLVTNPPIIS